MKAATCTYHPNRETALACSRCDRPICTECVVHSPVGMRCPECWYMRRGGITKRAYGDKKVLKGCITLLLIGSIALVLLVFASIIGGARYDIRGFLASSEPNRASPPMASGIGDTPTPRPTITPIATVALFSPYTPSPAATPTPSPIPTPAPIAIEITQLLDEYDRNKVRANAALRYSQNGKIPVSTSGYVSEVDEFYFTIVASTQSSSSRDEVYCHYADTRASFHIEKGQSISVKGRLIGESQYYSGDLDMSHCEIDGIDLDKNPTISARELRANTVQVICITTQSLTQEAGQAGTGVIIDAEKGIVLTVHHVVVNEAEREDCEKLYVKVQGRQERVPATIVKHCASIDRARIRVSPNPLSAMTLQPIYRAAAPAQVDQEIYFWGYGGGEGVLRMETGVVQRIGRDDVIADAHAIPGDSGAPVYDEYGHLLGTMSRGNASDRAVFTGDLCGEEVTPTRIPTTSASSPTSANSTPTGVRTATPSLESTDTSTPVPTSTPTATPTPTNTPIPVSQIVAVQVVQSVSTSTPTSIATATPTPTSTSTPVPVGATREYPIPLGESGTTQDDFMVSVVEVQKDAHDIVVQANENKSYYEEPLPGHVYIMARIRVSNLSAEPQSLSNNRWSVVGPSDLEFGQCRTRGGGFYYSYEVPDEYDDGRLMFQGGEIEGNLCFTVKSSDLDSLVMFDRSGSKWLFFDLQ